jgi:hypothetical protein
MSRQRERRSVAGEQGVAAGAALRELGADLRGELVCPQDSDYDDVRTVFNGMIDLDRWPWSGPWHSLRA